MNTQLVSIDKGRLVTTSLIIADTFGRRHNNVVRDICTLMAKCPEEFTALNFEHSEYIDSTGKHVPMYNLTRDGMTLLVMGYTGEKAIQFKLAYIDAFNKMEAMLAKQEKERLIAQAKRYLPMPEPQDIHPLCLVEMLGTSLTKYSHPGVRGGFKSRLEEERYKLAYEMYCAAIDGLLSVKRCVKSINSILKGRW